MKTTPTKQVTSMLRNTMLHLKHCKGVSLAQIRKHMEANYSTKFGNSNKKRLATTLKGLVQTGKVEKTPAGVYKLKKTEDAEGDKLEVPNRRRKSLPKGYCKTHSRYHRSHRHRRRSHRRRRSQSRRRNHRRRRTSYKTCTRHHKRRR